MIAVSYILQDIMFTFTQGPRFLLPFAPFAGRNIPSIQGPSNTTTLAAAPARKETSTGADVYLYDM